MFHYDFCIWKLLTQVPNNHDRYWVSCFDVNFFEIKFEITVFEIKTLSRQSFCSPRFRRSRYSYSRLQSFPDKKEQKGENHTSPLASGNADFKFCYKVLNHHFILTGGRRIRGSNLRDRRRGCGRQNSWWEQREMKSFLKNRQLKMFNVVTVLKIRNYNCTSPIEKCHQCRFICSLFRVFSD